MIIDGIEIPLDKTWRRIGISLSGGADSALLAYFIMENTNADIYFTTQIRMWKTRPWQEYVARDVVHWFQRRYENRIEHLTNFVPPELEEPVSPLIPDEYGKLKPGNRIILRAYNEYIAHKYKLDAWYAGVNLNPSEALEGSPPDRNVASIPPVLIHMGIPVHHPFVNVQKDWIVRRYAENNIVDLFDLTRSCEGEFEDLNYITYKPYEHVPVCGKCFWCLEREWGLKNALNH